MISKTFVGRKEELKQIREWLEKSAGGLVWITGLGGIGKTSLLRRIADQYSSDERFVVDYFDLAEQPMTIINQAVHLADSLGRGNFPTFMQKLTELDTTPGQSVTGHLEEEAIDACVQEVAIYLKSKKKKLLRITDTFEIALKYTLYEDNWAGGINERLGELAGTFFITAGRDKLDNKDILEVVHPLLRKLFKEEILHLPLAGFDNTEMEDFFAECDPHLMIPQEMREKLQVLTDGRPILLSLAVDWLQKEIPLPVMIDKSLHELREIVQIDSERINLQSQFEFELVSKMRELQSPLDIASLYMAHLDRRMDSQLLSVLLDVDDDKAGEYLQELLNLPFVKEYIGSNHRNALCMMKCVSL